jgi:hypothetical protein
LVSVSALGNMPRVTRLLARNSWCVRPQCLVLLLHFRRVSCLLPHLRLSIFSYSYFENPRYSTCRGVFTLPVCIKANPIAHAAVHESLLLKTRRRKALEEKTENDTLSWHHCHVWLETRWRTENPSRGVFKKLRGFLRLPDPPVGMLRRHHTRPTRLVWTAWPTPD